MAGALFAFISSFDELIVALFVSGTTAVTLPPQDVGRASVSRLTPRSPPVSTILIVFTGVLFLAAELFRRRSERLRTSTAAIAAE